MATQSKDSEKTAMFTKASGRINSKHVIVCLLLLAALLGVTVAAAAHTHLKQDIHEGQCALCMSYAQIVAVCAVVVVALLLALATQDRVFEHESAPSVLWIPPAQRVRPPPFA
jgi:cytochrome bd-type quinol oxidase subunit 2